MARPFSSKDAKLLINEHHRILGQLSTAASYTEHYRQEIKKASDGIISNGVYYVLKDVPIEEISRDRWGFRVKTLRDRGYSNVAEIWLASRRTLASIHGISVEAAYDIKNVVSNMAAKTRQSVKIKLSTDNKTPEATQLVSSIHRYNRTLPLLKTCQHILYYNSHSIYYALADIMPATSRFKWYFTSAAKQQKATMAYDYLRQLLWSEYGRISRDSLSALYAIGFSTYEEAWQEFSKNPIHFFNILEYVKPGVLGTDEEDVYGLPEDLALEIQNECFFPNGLICTLRRYQEWGVKYILHQEQVLLGDEMGLGKTIQAIAAMVSLRNTGATHFVVVCPASIITNWCREINKMSRLSVTKVHGSDRAAALRSWIYRGGVAVTTYNTIGQFKIAEDFKFSLLVVDEAHYVKNPEAQRTANVKKLRQHADRTLFMTGTPLENKVDEMIELIKMLQPRVAAQVQGMTFLATAPQFRAKIAPVYYRRRREDVLTELPDLIENQEWCALLPYEERVYEQAVLQRRIHDARKVSWSIDDLRGSSKARRLVEIVEEAESEGRKVIVFSFYLDTIKKISRLFGKKCLKPIDGSVRPSRRQEIIDEFDKAPAGTVLVTQIQTGGTGLNIQTASVVVICEPQYKPSTESQAISRAYRMGQTRNVLVYRLLCENTVDERVTTILENKQAQFDAFADRSFAAEKSVEIDDKTFGDIINDEIDRINAKYGR